MIHIDEKIFFSEKFSNREEHCGKTHKVYKVTNFIEKIWKIIIKKNGNISSYFLWYQQKKVSSCKIKSIYDDNETIKIDIFVVVVVCIKKKFSDDT